MFAVALEPEQFPNMLGLAQSFVLMDAAGLTYTKDMPVELVSMLEYLAEWCAPPPEDEKGARYMIEHWLKAYAMMYGSEVNFSGVDTLQ